MQRFLRLSVLAAGLTCLLSANAIPTTGLAAWYNGGSATTSTWTDLSGNGLNLGASGSPTVTNTGPNGQNVVNFNGATTYSLNSVAGTNWGATSADIFLVLDQTGGSGTGFSWSPDGNTRFLYHTAYSYQLYFQYGTPFSAGVANIPGNWYGNFHIVEGILSGQTAYVLVDGVLLATGSIPNALNTSQSATEYIGDDIFGNAFQGAIGEVAVYNHALSQADHQSVVDYLNTTYGMSASDASPLSDSVPEPSALVTGGLAVLALGAFRRWRAA